MSWKRPEHVPYPVVWERFEGKIPQTNGKPLQYRIQDITEELIDPAIDHMCKYFLVRENCFSHDGFVEDEETLSDVKSAWRKIFEHKVGLIAIVEGDGDDSKRIAGCNMLCVSQKTAPRAVVGKTEKLKKLFNVFGVIHSQQNVFEKYGIDKCLNPMGLSVAPQYQGDNVGYYLLKSRIPLCQACEIPLTATVFTNPAALHQALKVGFEVLWETTSDTFKIDGQLVYPRLKNVKLSMSVRQIPKLAVDEDKNTIGCNVKK